MTVYVDDAHHEMRNARGEKWFSSHMMADGHEELIDMAIEVECNIQWIQRIGHKFEHFDITQEMRKRAIAAGAVKLTQRELVRRMKDREGPGR